MDLWEAVEQNNAEAVARLLREGADPNEKRGRRHLLDAVPHRGDDVKCLLLEAGAWTPDLRGDTVWAVNVGRPSVLRILLERGADPNMEALMGRPLQVAARRGDLESVRLLLTAGADPNSGGLNHTALTAAVEAGHTEVVQLLLEHGALPDLEARSGGQRALQLAAVRGSLPMVRALAERGAELNFRARHVTLPQSAPASSPQGALDALKSLLSADSGSLLKNLFSPDAEEAGAAGEALVGKLGGREEGGAATRVPEIRSFRLDNQSLIPEAAQEATALCLAARQGHPDVVEYLLQTGADPHVRDAEGLTPRQWAERNEHAQVLEIFVRRGITEQQTPDQRLLQAALVGDKEAAAQALEDGANIEARDERMAWRGCTPLMLAAESGNPAIVKLLLERGADPTAHDGEGKAPSWHHQESTPEQLRSRGLPLGRTALHCACARGHAALVPLLRQGGLAVKDFCGFTPLALALRARHTEVAQELLRTGAVAGHEELMCALESGHRELIPLLLPGLKPKREALLEACAWGDATLVRLLLQHGADARRSVKNKAPLVAAVSAMHYATEDNPDGSRGVVRTTPPGHSRLVPLPEESILGVVEALLEAGADPEATGSRGSALQHMLTSGYVRVAERLIRAGARVTPKMVGDAESYGHAELARLLAAHASSEAPTPTSAPPSPPKRPRPRKDTWGPEVPVTDFTAASQRPEFQEVLRQLEERCGSAPVEMGHLRGAFRVHVRGDRQAQLSLEAIQQQMLPGGALVLRTDTLSEQNWAVYPTADPYEVLAAWQTNGCNVSVGTGYLLQWLRQLEAQCPLRYLTISQDTIEALFLGKLPPVNRLARQIDQICPDVVSQGVGSVKALAQELASSKRLYLWWD